MLRKRAIILLLCSSWTDVMENLRACWFLSKICSAIRSFYGLIQEVYIQNRTRPFQDPQDLTDFCHSCSSFNSLLNMRTGYACLTCQTPFTYCPVSFEHLPLVEFHLSPDISQSEALNLLSMEKASDRNDQPPQVNDTMTFNQAKAGSNDQFFADFQRAGLVLVNREMLRALREEEVVVLRMGPAPPRWRFFRNMLADVVRVTACSTCWKVFNHDDFFASVLELGSCPFCREPAPMKNEEE